MKLPNYENAYISKSKIAEYLLSETHILGKTKAVFFTSMGYSSDNWQVLKEDLLSIASSADIHEEISTDFGMKYILDGVVESPSGKTINLRTVWITEKSSNNPRLITAFPR